MRTILRKISARVGLPEGKSFVTDSEQARALTLNNDEVDVFVFGYGPKSNGENAVKIRKLEQRWSS